MKVGPCLSLSFFLISLCITHFSYASNQGGRSWRKVKIPGAVCGDSRPYHVLVSTTQNSEKWAFELMGGGACWNRSSCWGPNLRAWIHPVPKVKIYGRMSSNNSFLKGHNMVYFPYCTGDVHSGDHAASYGRFKVEHRGRSNMRKSLLFLELSRIVKWKNIKDFVLYGSSAGALGSLIHAKSIEKRLSRKTKKTLILDSPGLHWDELFWDRFSPELLNDYKKAFTSLGLKKDIMDDMPLSQYTPRICKNLKSWQIGIIQGARDIVMGQLFGHMTSEQHKETVYGPMGALALTRNVKNCYTWSPDAAVHAYLVFSPLTKNIKVEGLNSYEFAKNLYENKLTGNYPSEAQALGGPWP